jgi:hypothetical protein
MQAIEKLLHIPFKEQDYALENALPLFLRGAYELKTLQVEGVSFLCAAPKEKVNLAAMRKHRNKLKELTGMECVFCVDSISTYTKGKMLEEGIPFILGEKEVYLPFLGMILNNAVKKDKERPLRIAYLTQKMLLTVLYQKITNASVTDMAKILGVSKMSVTRCFDELEAFELGLIQNNGTVGRYLISKENRKAFWETIKPILRNPVEKQYFLDCIPPWPLPAGGLTAISHFTMLADNSYTTYAMTKQQAKELQPENLPQVPHDEIPVSVLQIMGYSYPFEDAGESVIDPLTAVLSLNAEELSDPRIEGAVQKIMEEFVV